MSAAFFSDIPALFHAKPITLGELIALEPEEAGHIRALRLRVGDPVQLLDGAGRRSRGRIERVEKREITVRVEDTVLEEPEKGVYIGLAVGVLGDKGRMEWLVEKSVELGVAALYPLRSLRTEGFFNVERARRVAVAALKQSQRAWLPQIHGTLAWSELADVAATYDLLLLCHEQGAGRESLADLLRNLSGIKRVLILVGPEGGFSDAEITEAGEVWGARLITLGKTRLRSETAALAALAGLMLLT